MAKRLIAAAMVLLASVAPSSAQQPRLTNEQHEAAVQFVMGNVRHTMLHEIGHLLVDQLNLPVLGREEDAVDTMATVMMLETGTQADVAALQDTVDGWLYSEATRPTRGYVNADFYGAHSLDIQRSYAIACLMVGSDYDKHTHYATRISLPIDRQNSCAEDYRIAEQGWNTVLEPYRRVGAIDAAIDIQYRDSRGEYPDVEALLRQERVLEFYADWVAKNFVLPNPVRMTAESCGEVNAFYDLETREVILCYEWVDFFYDLFVTEVMPVREHFALVRKLKLEKLGRPE
ncbi:DUF4344 domain-containing metallopeptidase [Pelagibacterium sp. 26DY04]|uniref:DUF4344 domain-containing metallopeptidase n=1 Tax=Pelagibacterium sp. 26DY04 TaxID=2967130 RepID=UPI002814E01C|nr:DUF4344 domain-containing metallopeptidase [Pelagibacterium sp. 26DY04]WMT88412.1 DUF4344 domain-containing metallopeptidase [Pelagibacterium sp. 26DY04]